MGGRLGPQGSDGTRARALPRADQRDRGLMATKKMKAAVGVGTGDDPATVRKEAERDLDAQKEDNHRRDEGMA